MSDYIDILWKNIAAVVIFLLLTGVLAWLTKHFVTWKAYDKRQKALDTRDEEINKALAKHGELIAVLQSEMTRITTGIDNLPRREDFHALQSTMLALEGSVKALGASMKGLKELVRRDDEKINMLLQNQMNSKGGQ